MSRFPGWTCFADQQPTGIGPYIVGFAEPNDVKVWHQVPCLWARNHWYSERSGRLPDGDPKTLFYKLQD